MRAAHGDQLQHGGLARVGALFGKVDVLRADRNGEGNSAISSRVCPATSGKKASTNAWASAGVLYIFQLAAISALRDMSLSSSIQF
jgi:hypothetical protein